MTTDEMLRQAAYLLTYASFEDDVEGDGFGEERHSDADKLLWQVHEYLLDKNPSTSISSEEVDKSTQKRLAIQNAKPPLNGDQILEGFKELGLAHYDYRIRCFTEGVRFAERMRDE